MDKLFHTIKFILLSILFLSFSGCESFLDENNVDGKYTEKEVWASPSFAEGVMLKAYKSLPSDYNFDSDYVTNDMVTNQLTSSTREMAMGSWTQYSNPLSNYSSVYSILIQLNDFLAHVDQVDFAPLSSEDVKVRYRTKLKGEALALRAWWCAELLQACGGETADGSLLGYPIVTSVLNNVDNALLPRNTYAECVNQIIDDCDKALSLIPLNWVDDDDDEVATRIEGLENVNRMHGTAVMVLKARVLLRAASPAFEKSGRTWEEAALAAREVMKLRSDLDLLENDDVTYWDKGKDIASLNSNNEIIWYTNLLTTATSRETRNYPPTKFGTARVNPSQNFIDCFPAINGYPISDIKSQYNSGKQYDDRDPRLAKLVVWNKSKLGGSTILTSSSNDAIGATINSTRTGYYLRKFLDETVDLTKGKVIKGESYFVNMRYTEVLLNFAEACNEIGGPDHDVDGMSARKVIIAIRKRSGISDQTYVNQCDVASMRELIKNERRIELCFEGFRFWDLCRWIDIDEMNNNVIGYEAKSSSIIDVENRNYKDYMIYPPIPNSERLLGLKQNRGWE